MADFELIIFTLVTAISWEFVTCSDFGATYHISERRSAEILNNCSSLSAESYTPTCPDGVHGTNGIDGYHCNTTHISFWLYLEHFHDINDVSETLITSGSIQADWEMPCANYFKNQETVFYTDQDMFWKPHLHHRNAVNNIGMDGSSGWTSRFYVYIYNNNVLWFQWQRTGVFESTCEMDFRLFPFDTQTCAIELILMEVYPAAKISDVAGDRNFTIRQPVFLAPGNTWELLDNYTSYITSDEEIHGRRTLIIFSMSFRRNPLFFIYNLMLPGVYLTSLQVGSLLMAGILPDRPVYACTLLLAMGLVQGQILDRVPAKPQRIFISNFADFCTLLSWSCTIYCLASCFYSRSWRKWFEENVAFMPFPISRARFVDLFAFAVASILFLGILGYAISVARSENYF